MDEKKILEKAKNTEYRHKHWFKEGGKSVYEAIKHFVECGDFYLDFSSRINYASQIKGYDGLNSRKDVTDWLIEKKRYNKLIIRYAGKEKGTDRGVLKVKTFLALKNALK
jgi:hypothetical protein